MRHVAIVVLALVVVLAACGHRAEFQLADVTTSRDGVRSNISLVIVCSAEVGTTCASLGDICVSAQWSHLAQLVDSVTECRPNKLREGDRLPLSISSTQAIPRGSEARLILSAASAKTPDHVYVLPQRTVMTD